MNYFGFVDESGVLDESKKVQPFFSVGMLKVSDTSLITERLSQRHYDYFSTQKSKRRDVIGELTREPRELSSEELNLLLASTRHHEYKFTRITHTTLTRYKQFIDTAVEFPLHFCALVVDKTDPSFDTTIYRNYWHAYISYTKLICRKNCDAGNQLCVVADYMNRPSDSEEFFEKEINELPNIFNTLRAHSETFMLLQLTDLLLGSVVFQWRQAGGFVQNSNRAKAKQLFVEHLVNKLDIPSDRSENFPLAQHITINRPFYFNVWPLQLSKIQKTAGVSRMLDSPLP